MAAYGDMDQGVAGLVNDTLGLAPKTKTGIVQEALTAGTPVFGYTNSGEKVWKLKADVTKLVFSADLVTLNSVTITVKGTASSAVVYTTSHANTMALIVTAIKAISGAEAVLDSTDTTSRTILIRTKGATCTASGAVTLGASQATVTATTGLFGQVFMGVVALGNMVPTTIGGTASFAAYDPCCVVYDSEIWAQAGSGVDTNEKAYVSVSTGIFSATTTDQDVGVRCKVGYTSASGVAKVYLPNMPVPLTYADCF